MRILTEKEAENFLEKEGFNISERDVIGEKTEIGYVTKKIKFPWAMKIISDKIIHKKREGGVFLNINNLDQAKKAFEQLAELAGFKGVIIQPIMKGEELILGLKKTPEFGLVIMLGKGGSDVEKEKDVSFRVLPIEKKDAQEMIEGLKFYRILKEKGANFAAIEANLLKLSALSKKHLAIDELDINPLMVNEKEAKVVDARIVFS
jgi:acyl-CoA synthetase (NDP forming)